MPFLIEGNSITNSSTLCERERAQRLTCLSMALSCREFKNYKSYKGLTPLRLTLMFSLFYDLKNLTQTLKSDEQRI
jgi:hypothetical protein